jgi:hypothetical protein
MGAFKNLAESKGWQKPAPQSKFRCVIIKIGAGLGFWKAALRITPYFQPIELGHRINNSPNGTFHRCRELC